MASWIASPIALALKQQIISYKKFHFQLEASLVLLDTLIKDKHMVGYIGGLLHWNRS